jgi:hypothetical protein
MRQINMWWGEASHLRKEPRDVHEDIVDIVHGTEGISNLSREPKMDSNDRR